MEDIAEVDGIRSPKLVRSSEVRQRDAILQGDSGERILGLDLDMQTLSTNSEWFNPFHVSAICWDTMVALAHSVRSQRTSEERTLQCASHRGAILAKCLKGYIFPDVPHRDTNRGHRTSVRYSPHGR